MNVYNETIQVLRCTAIKEYIMNSRFNLSRLARTATSEIYMIWDGDKRVGQLHIHYVHSIIHVALMLEIDLSISEQDDLISQIDEDIISSYLPSFEREDMLVTIYRGEEINSFSYSPSELDDMDDDE